MHKAGTSENFLATTALEDFWDTSKPLLFLGRWCLRYSRRSFWESLGGEVVCSPWDNRKKLLGAYRYVNDVYERLLPLLAEVLNAIHGLKYSERYWRIVIGPWLQLYITVCYDRYISLRVVMDRYSEFTTTGLSVESFITPRNTLDFVQVLKEDLYNLQLYTRILMALGKNFTRKSVKELAKPYIFPENEMLWKVFAKRFAKNILNTIEKTKQNDRIVILKNSHFSNFIELQLFLKTNGKVWPNKSNIIELPLCPVDHYLRSKLQGLILEKCEFETILINMLSLDMPQSFIERYEDIKNQIENNYPSKPKAIFSANSWYYDEVFKQWSAASAENGTILIGVQHGGNYGSIVHMTSETHELSITDRYYSWGWNRSDCISKVIPLPATKLVGRKIMGDDNKKKDILFVATSVPRYLIQFPITANQFSNYLAWQTKFVTTILPEIRVKLRVRLHREELGWDLAQRWTEHYPDIFLENWDITFLRSLENCRLFVCDHLSTTFIEALSVDKPTILFWNQEANELRPEVKPYYDQLRAVGILYDVPEDAGHAVNFVYKDIKSWWNEPQRQAIRRNFCNQFGRTSPNAFNEWVYEFKQIVNCKYSK